MNLHAAGRFKEAEALYDTILESSPRHAAANHALGLLLVSTKHAERGLGHLLIALEEAPAIPDYWLGYLEALLASGNIADAEMTHELGRNHGLAGAAADDFARRLQAAKAASAANAALPPVAASSAAPIAAPSMPPSPAPNPSSRDARQAMRMEKVFRSVAMVEKALR